ncbi:carboxypeptidase-like regulatory domain-containing protein [Deinococcus ficus]|uniref:carboxypeptidase-like regulatory domain-containing protein n=1 Tax=Deinococcus ficus TaxID=317577 RepID=UPI000A0145E8|nr:carboxypeptidase-like regulatory domain-containing protein [Deinococcus ficus]
MYTLPNLICMSLLVASIVSCGGSSGATPGQQNPPPPAAGLVTGTVKDQAGNPLKNVEIIADNTAYYNTNVIGYTDAQGAYKLDISRPAGTWNITANQKLTYKGKTIDVPLEAEDERVVSGTEGGTRNFIYRPGTGPYGNLGLVVVDATTGSYPDLSKVSVHLKSIGALADGTSNVEISSELTQTGSGWLIKNVMYGTYEVEATLDGQPLYVRQKPNSGSLPYNEMAIVAEFTDGGFNFTRPVIQLEVSDSPCPEIFRECK